MITLVLPANIFTPSILRNVIRQSPTYKTIDKILQSSISVYVLIFARAKSVVFYDLKSNKRINMYTSLNIQWRVRHFNMMTGLQTQAEIQTVLSKYFTFLPTKRICRVFILSFVYFFDLRYLQIDYKAFCGSKIHEKDYGSESCTTTHLKCTM